MDTKKGCLKGELVELDGNNGDTLTLGDVKHALTNVIEGMDHVRAKSMARELIAEDQEFSETMIRGFPRVVNFSVQLLKALAESLDRLSVDRSSEMLAGALRQVDGVEIGQVINALSRFLIKLHEAKPGLIADSRVALISDAVGEVDFGKLRKAATEHYHSKLLVLEGKVDKVVGFPLGLANLLNVVPPLLNDLLRILAKTLTHLKFPDELLANALFTLVGDIDMREAGQVLNAAADLVIALSHGDQILGNESEPLLKEVLIRLGRELSANVNAGMLKEAALALGKDGKVIGEVFSEYVFSTDARTLSFLNALLVPINGVVKMLGETVVKIAELPDGVIAQMAEGMEENFEAEEVGRLFNSLTTLFNRMAAKNPDMVSEMLKRVITPLDLEQSGAACKTLVLQMKDAAFAAPNLSSKLAPSVIGKTVNTGLVSFNRFSKEKAEFLAVGLSDALAELDAKELNQAVDGAMSQLVEAALRNGEIVKAVIRPIISGGFKYVKGSIKNMRVFRRFIR